MDTSFLTQKVGPLPAYGWLIAVGGGALLFRTLRKDQEPAPTVSLGVDPQDTGEGEIFSPSGSEPVTGALTVTDADGNSFTWEGDPTLAGSLLDRFYDHPPQPSGPPLPSPTNDDPETGTGTGEGVPGGGNQYQTPGSEGRSGGTTDQTIPPIPAGKRNAAGMTFRNHSQNPGNDGYAKLDTYGGEWFWRWDWGWSVANNQWEIYGENGGGQIA